MDLLFCPKLDSDFSFFRMAHRVAVCLYGSEQGRELKKAPSSDHVIMSGPCTLVGSDLFFMFTAFCIAWSFTNHRVGVLWLFFTFLSKIRYRIFLEISILYLGHQAVFPKTFIFLYDALVNQFVGICLFYPPLVLSFNVVFWQYLFNGFWSKTTFFYIWTWFYFTWRQNVPSLSLSLYGFHFFVSTENVIIFFAMYDLEKPVKWELALK